MAIIPTVKAQDITSNLAGHWTLDDETGANIVDETGGGNNGVWTDGANNDVTEESTPVQLNTGFTFDGDNLIAMPTNAFKFTGDVSFMAWILPDGTGSDVERFLSWDSGSTQPYVMIVDQDGVEAFSCQTSGGGSATLNTAVNNQLYHIACVYDATAQTLTLYVDGVERAVDLTAGSAISYTAFGQQKLFIGGDPDTSNYHGLADDVRVYNRALTAADIEAVFRLRCTNPNGFEGGVEYFAAEDIFRYCADPDWVDMTGAPTTGLVGYWKLDEETGQSITDYGTGGNNGTWVDGANDDVGEETTTGKVSKALTFDAANTNIAIGADADIDNIFDGGGTISAWIRADTTGQNGFGRIAQKGVTDSNGWELYVDNTLSGSTANLNFRQNHGSGADKGTWETTGFPITVGTGTWYHIAVTHDSSSTANNPIIYVNGASVAFTEVNTPSSAYDSDAAQDLIIGDRGAFDRAFDGEIDEVRLYNQILSPTEVANLYKATGGKGTCSDAGEINYDTTNDVMEWCNGTNTFNMGPATGGGGGGCTSPTGVAGSINYYAEDDVYQFCDGTNWISTGTKAVATSNGLVGHWKLEDTDTTAVDERGANNGTMFGGLDGANDSTPAQDGNGLVFDGNDYISAGDVSFDAVVDDELTIALWFQLNSLPTDINSRMSLVSKYSAPDGERQYQILIGDNVTSDWDAIHWNVQETPGSFDADNVMKAGALSVGPWYHLVVTYVGGTSMKVYLNGSLSAEKTTDVATDYGDTNEPLIIGSQDDGVDLYFDGAIDDVRVYDRALTDDEISSLYSATGG